MLTQAFSALCLIFLTVIRMMMAKPLERPRIAVDWIATGATISPFRTTAIVDGQDCSNFVRGANRITSERIVYQRLEAAASVVTAVVDIDLD